MLMTKVVSYTYSVLYSLIIYIGSLHQGKSRKLCDIPISYILVHQTKGYNSDITGIVFYTIVVVWFANDDH